MSEPQLVILHPTIAGAVGKIERSLVYLKVTRPTSDLLADALEHLKSALKLVGAHRVTLIELEAELPAPGPALFDATGAPAPGAELVAALAAGSITTDDVVLGMKGKDWDDLAWKDQQRHEADLWFAVRLHMRLRALQDTFDEVHDLVEDEFGGMSIEIWDWLVGQVKTSGTFEWPHRCANVECNAPREADEELCPDCLTIKNRQDWEAKEKARKAGVKAAKPKKAKATPKPATNPLVVAPEGDEGGEE